MSRRPALRRGSLVAAVTGHRLDQLDSELMSKLTRAAEGIFRALERAHEEARGEPLPRYLRSGLAEGADRIATRIARAHGWIVESVLPFQPERYIRDFGGAPSRREFYQMLEESTVRSVIDGEVLERRDPNLPYAEAGRDLIDGVQVVIAMWNGHPPKGPGGTAEVAALALEQGSIVIWLSVTDLETRLIGPAPLPRAGSFKRALFDLLREDFTRIARPPEMRIA